LEIYRTEKRRPSELLKKREALGYSFKIFGIDMPREKLYKNINKRVEDMFRQGIVKEVKNLSRRKLSLTARKALGYNEVIGYIKGDLLLGQAKELLKKNTRHFAKRQLTWFRPDKRIAWNNFTFEARPKM